ncbi:hypothetical protein ABZ923_26370 [Streptomyces sp. NPDC046881]|uniref:hypothetical protein n=1 Tax=Streptomyces sp. NPDC046881 TaxID=3155374 RepID=UPI0033E58ADB
MPRGRHRHSPPLHRLLPPSAIAGVSVVCALGPWVFSEATVVRALAAAAAATAVVGAVVMRRWDAQAGKQVAELTRARAGDEWRFEERVAELETDLEESRELRAKLEQRLRAKRAELAGLRNEHAALLRRYATAETERASALEGRRLLELEAGVPEPSSAPALPPARSSEPETAGTEVPAASAASEDEPAAYAVFSPEGAQLYLQALTALVRFGRGTPGEPEPEPEPEPDGGAEPVADAEAEGVEASDAEPDQVEAGEPQAALPEPAEADADARADADADAVADAPEAPAEHESGARADAEEEGAAETVTDGADASRAVEAAAPAGQPPAGHFTVPTAVAVVPAPPARRPVVEGGFDFFGTQKDTPKATLDSVQNEDLADVVGPEALAVHKAEAEAGFKPADARSREVGQVIDLTAHDETEQIDVQRLRSAAS